MKHYTVQVSRPAQKNLRTLPAKIKDQIVAALDALKSEPRPHGYKKMVGYQDTYRIRVGDYRIVYEIHEKEVLVLVIRIGHRKDIYNG